MKTIERLERQAVLLDRQREDLWDDLDALVDLERRRWEVKHWLLAESGDPVATFQTGTNVELIYKSLATGTAKNTFTAEAQINDTAGMGVQAKITADLFGLDGGDIGRTFRIVARGIVSSTATPTYTFTLRGGAAGSTATAILLGSSAITTGSGISNQQWVLDGEIVLTAIAAVGNNSTIRGTGEISGGGFASPFQYPVWGGAASPGTVATVDTSNPNFINFNVACSASSASNTITLQQLFLFGCN